MAEYHFQVRSPISRGKGQSAVAKAAYNARETLRDERTDERKDYSRNKDEVLFSGIFVDSARNPPEWVKNREALWNAAVGKEKRKDAREAQEIIVALPAELTDKQREYLIKDFVREHIMRGTGRIADVNIHRPPVKGDDRNYHAHILLTLREIGPDGFGSRLPEMMPQDIVRLRTRWAERGAKELRKAGFEIEADRWAVGHKTQEQQKQNALERGDFERAVQLRRIPSKHRGPGATAMERRGFRTDRGDSERSDAASAAELTKLERELAAVKREIRVTQREAGRKPRTASFKDAATRATAPQMGRDESRAGSVAHKAVGKGANVVSSALHVLSGALESLLAPPEPKLPEQIKHQARRAEAAAQEKQIDWEQFVHASDFERRKAQTAEHEKAEQRERDEWMRQGRKREGRER